MDGEGLALCSVLLSAHTGGAVVVYVFFFTSRRRHTRFKCDWSSDVCSSDLDLLPALDNLHRALEAARNGGDVNQLAQGVQMVAKQFDDILAKHSIVPIAAANKPFDPNLRSEEHTSELQSHLNLVCRLLLEKK